VPNVTFDQRSVRIDGKPVPILCGAIHYARSTPGMWRKILTASVEAGINTIDTYVFWGLHEREKRKYDFTGRLDLPYFLSLCQELKLHVILRIGPYVCAETNFGGLPPWLIHEPGLVTRTNNDAFKREVLTWCMVLMAQVGQFQATRGGPIILAQLENEYNTVAKRYGDEGAKYMDWVVASAPEFGLDVPLVMCEAPSDTKLELSQHAAPRIIKGLNGFAVADRVPEFHRQFPNTPAFWTEMWCAWYSNFGEQQHYREPSEIVRAITHFFAVGGSGVSYYMWHGGTNFGRESVYLQTTSYDSSAPLDEYGLPQRAYPHLKRLHDVIRAHSELLLEGQRDVRVLKPAKEGGTLPQAAIYRCAKGAHALLFLINESSEPVSFELGALSLPLKPASAAIVLDLNGDQRVLFESHPQVSTAVALPPPPRWTPSRVELAFECFDEPLPDALPPHAPRPIVMKEPSSMLPYTRDLSDYAWYQTVISSTTEREATLTFPEVHDFSTLFVNGIFVGSQPERLNEDPKIHARHEYSVRLNKGQNRVTVLASALGLIKGDWAYDAPMNEEKKGLVGHLHLDGIEQPLWWTLHAGLFGENAGIFEPATSDLVAWKPIGGAPRRLRWFRAHFKAPDIAARALALEVGSLFKGLLWLNGECLGRYWQIPAVENLPEWIKPQIKIFGVGEPSQRRYHIPQDWIRDENTLIIFEETSSNPDGVRIVERQA
jgi:beta-galactosidase